VSNLLQTFIKLYIFKVPSGGFTCQGVQARLERPLRGAIKEKGIHKPSGKPLKKGKWGGQRGGGKGKSLYY
jgi:hypothetical protein